MLNIKKNHVLKFAAPLLVTLLLLATLVLTMTKTFAAPPVDNTSVNTTSQTSGASTTPTTQTVTCKDEDPTFLSFPTWYKYLPKNPSDCSPQLSGLADIWLVVAAVIEILLRVGSILAVVFVIYGGFQYMTSRGEPDKTNRARGTILNAVIGLVISIIAAGVVSFAAGSIK